MAERVSLGKTRGFVGVGTPQPERHRGDRREVLSKVDGAAKSGCFDLAHVVRGARLAGC
jgi:hypothetical protein